MNEVQETIIFSYRVSKDNYEAMGDLGIVKKEYRVFIGADKLIYALCDYKFITEENIPSIEDGMKYAQEHYEELCEQIINAISE